MAKQQWVIVTGELVNPTVTPARSFSSFENDERKVGCFALS